MISSQTSFKATTPYLMKQVSEKTVFFVRLYINVISLPRQVRDKHRESTHKRLPFCCAAEGRLPRP
jgi:hypothetical protein